MADDKIANLRIGGRKLKENEFIAAVNDTLSENMVSGLSEIAIQLTNELTKNAPVGGTRSLSSGVTLLGITENPDQSGYRIEILFSAEYHDYIDKGVEGVVKKGRTLKNDEGRTYKFKSFGMPQKAIDSLKTWAQGKNIEAAAESKIAASEGRASKRTRKFSPSEAAARRLAYLIKRNGIKPRNFKAKSVQTISKDMNKTLRKIAGKSFVLQVVK